MEVASDVRILHTVECEPHGSYLNRVETECEAAGEPQSPVAPRPVPRSARLTARPKTLRPAAHPDRPLRFVYSSRVLTPQGLRERTRSVQTASHGPNMQPNPRPKAPDLGPETPRRGPRPAPPPHRGRPPSASAHVLTASVVPPASCPLPRNDTKRCQKTENSRLPPRSESGERHPSLDRRRSRRAVWATDSACATVRPDSVSERISASLPVALSCTELHSSREIDRSSQDEWKSTSS